MASLQWLARPSEISTSITFLQYSPPNLLYSHHSHLIAVQKLWGRSCLWAFAPAAFSVWSALPPVNPQLTRFLPSETFYHFPSDHKLCTPPSLLHCSLSCLNIPSACTEYKECFFFSPLTVSYLSPKKTEICKRGASWVYFHDGCILLCVGQHAAYSQTQWIFVVRVYLTQTDGNYSLND